MPELPEVETTCSAIRTALVNKKIEKIIVRQPQLRWPIDLKAMKRLHNQPISAVNRRAKYILIQFPIGTLIIHLGMSGRLCLLNKDTQAVKHDHIDWQLNDDLMLRYHDPRRFGAVLWAKDLNHIKQLQHLGPEPLSLDFNASYLFEKTQKARCPIKALIMNQKIVVGVGNIYAVESLFLAKINPLRPSKTLSSQECTALVTTIQSVLKKAIQQGGTTLKDFYQANGQPGYFSQELNVYGHEGQPCKACKTPIIQTRLQNRATCYCPKCQK